MTLNTTLFGGSPIMRRYDPEALAAQYAHFSSVASTEKTPVSRVFTPDELSEHYGIVTSAPAPAITPEPATTNAGQGVTLEDAPIVINSAQDHDLSLVSSEIHTFMTGPAATPLASEAPVSNLEYVTTASSSGIDPVLIWLSAGALLLVFLKGR